MKTINKRVGHRIKVRRAELEMNQGELAKAVGIDQSYLSHLENGTRRIDVEMLERIAQSLRCRMTDLLDEGKRAA